MTTKTPFIVHCGECKHEWTAFYSPMPLSDAAAIIGSLRCPMCAADTWNIFCGFNVAEILSERINIARKALEAKDD